MSSIDGIILDDSKSFKLWRFQKINFATEHSAQQILLGEVKQTEAIHLIELDNPIVCPHEKLLLDTDDIHKIRNNSQMEDHLVTKNKQNAAFIWRHRNNIICSNIKKTISQELIETLDGIDDAHEAFKRVEEYYLTADDPSNVLRELLLTKFTFGDDLDKFFSDIIQKWHTVTSHPDFKTVPDTVLIHNLHWALPSQFDIIKYDLKRRDNLNLETLIKEYKNGYKNMDKGLASATTFALSHSKPFCQFCKDRNYIHDNHTDENCGHQHPLYKQPKSRFNNTNTQATHIDKRSNTSKIASAALYTMEFQRQLNLENAMFDQGAEVHCTGRRDIFDDFTQLTPPIPFETPGGIVWATGVGTARITLTYNHNNVLEWVLEHCYYSKSFPTTLISADILISSGLEFHWIPRKEARFYDPVTKQVKITIPAINNKVIFPIVPRNSLNISPYITRIVASITNKGDTLSTWHARLGHINKNDLIKVLKRLYGTDYSNDEIKCETCQLNKSTQPSFDGHLTATMPLETIHTDIIGPLKYKGQYNYIYTLTDAYTRYTTIYHLNSRDQCFNFFTHFHREIENQTGYKIKKIHSDRAKEFTSNNMSLYFSQHGIKYELTAGYAPQSNGIAERYNRTLEEGIRTLLTEAKLPASLWPYAANYFCEIKNKLPHSNLQGKTPTEVLFHQTPNLHRYKIFGCRAYILIRNNSKFEPKRAPGIFLGFENDSNGAYILIHDRIEISRNVHYDETIIPGYEHIIQLKGASHNYTHSLMNIRDPYKVLENQHNREDDENVDTNDDTDHTKEQTNDTNDHGHSAQYHYDQEEHLPNDKNDTSNLNVELGDPSKSLTQDVNNDIFSENAHLNNDNILNINQTDMKNQNENHNDIFNHQNLDNTSLQTDQEMQNNTDNDNTTPNNTNLNINHNINTDQQHPYRTNLPNEDITNHSIQYDDHNNNNIDNNNNNTDNNNNNIDNNNNNINNNNNNTNDNNNNNTDDNNNNNTDNNNNNNDHIANRKRKLSQGPQPIIIGMARQQNLDSQKKDRARKLRIISKDTYHHPTGSAFTISKTTSNHLTNHIPTTFNQAMTHPMADYWMTACEEELLTHERNQTWSLINADEIPGNRQLIGCRWVFTMKTDADHNPIKYKARLVAQGFSQRPGIDFAETYAPVTSLRTIRLLLATAVNEGLHIHQMDVTGAYLYGTLDEPIYMKLPQTLDKDKYKNKVCKLQKALYGLKQSGRIWFKTLEKSLNNIGFTSTHVEPSLFHSKELDAIVSVYVDDLLIISKNVKTIEYIKELLTERFEMKDLGVVNHLLGLKIQYDIDKGVAQVDLAGYIRNTLEALNLTGIRRRSTPMSTNLTLSIEDAPKSEEEKIEMKCKPYAQAIGALNWISNAARPDISYATNVCSRFTNNPGIKHWNQVIHIFGYLKKTINLKIIYNREEKEISGFLKGTLRTNKIEGYTDADYAGCKDTKRSTSGYVFTIAGGAIAWGSKRQHCTASSTCEAEYKAIQYGSEVALWIKHVLGTIDRRIEYGIPINTDNRAAYYNIIEIGILKGLKHVEVHFHASKDRHNMGLINIQKIGTNDQLADLFTKALDGNRLRTLGRKMGLIDENTNDTSI